MELIPPFHPSIHPDDEIGLLQKTFLYEPPIKQSSWRTVSFLNIWTPQKIVLITLKVEQDGVSLEEFIQKMQRELQTV